jgi:hypothetical protein
MEEISNRNTLAAYSRTSERDRCLALMRSVPWWYLAEHTGKVIGEVFAGLIEHGVPAADAWVVTGRGTCVHKGHGVRLYDIKRVKGRRECNLGYMLYDNDNETWDAVVHQPGQGCGSKADRQDGFPGAFEASAWVAERWDALKEAA